MNESFGSFYRTLEGKEREALIDALRSHLRQRPEIVFAYIFGSFVSGMPFQDIDLALWVDTRLTDNPREFAEDCADLLDAEFRHVFDIVILNSAPSSFKASVFTEGRLLFSRGDDLLNGVIESCSLDMLANEGLSRQSLVEIAQ